MKCSRFVFFSTLLMMLVFTACEPYYEDDFGADDFMDTAQESDDGDYIEPFADDLTILTSYEIQGNEIIKLKDFDVKNKYLIDQQDYSKHLAMWDYYIALIPIEHRRYISEFLIIHGEGDVGGYVEPVVQGSLDKWRMGLSIDVGGDLSTVDLQAELAYIIVHEFGHVLTLNPTQVVVQEESSCQTFHTGEGCSKVNSYINSLFDLAWSDIYNQYSEEEADLLYEDHKDRFVSDYAATNPGEDIAEVFTTYVIEQNVRSGHSIADKKIQLLDSYPELQSLRVQIRQVPAVRLINNKHKKYQHARINN